MPRECAVREPLDPARAAAQRIPRRRRPIAVVCAGIVPLAACTPPPIVAGVPRTAEHVLIAPYASHVECVDMRRGDRLDWRFDASVALSFDIHYREGNAAIAPVVRDAATDSGTLEAREPATYCATWEAGPAGASLDYRLLLRTPTR